MRIRTVFGRVIVAVLAFVVLTSSCFAVLNRKNSAKGNYGSGTEIFASSPVTFSLSDGTKFTLESRVRCVTIAPGDCLHANSVFAYFYVLTIPAGGAPVTQRITLQLTAPFDPHNSSSMNFGILDQLDSNNFGTVIADCPAPAGSNPCVDAVLENTSSADANGTLTFNLNPQTLSSQAFQPGDQIFLYATSFTRPNCAFDLSLGLSCSSPTSLTTALNLSSPSGAINPSSTQGLAPVLPTAGRRLQAPDESTYFLPQTSFTGNKIDAQATKGTIITPLSGFVASGADHMGCQGCAFIGGQAILNVSYGYLYNLTIPTGTDVTALPATITVVLSAPFNQDDFEFLTFGTLGTTANFSSVSSNVASCGSFGTTTGAAYDTCLDAIVTTVVSQPQAVAGVPRPPTSLTFTITTSNLTAGDNVVLFATSNNKPNTCNTTTLTCLSTTPITLSGDASVSLSIATGSPNTVVGPSDPIPVPSIASLSPNSATQSSGAFTLAVNGSNFVVGAQVLWNGSPRQTIYISSAQVTATIPATDLQSGGTVPVTVSNPPNPSVGPNPEVSSPMNFTVNSPNPVPSITSFSPASALASAAAFTLTINGSGFVPTSVVSFNGSAKTTTFVTSSSLTVPITASDVATAGSFPFTVFNPAPGGGTSTPLNFPVNNPAPTVTSLAPATVTAGGSAFSLTVNGTGFVSSSQVNFNGSPRATTFTSSTVVSAAITAADIANAGSATITVTNSAPGGGTSTGSAASTLTINNPAPIITSLLPSSTLAGSPAFTLTVNGTNFVSGSKVSFAGTTETTIFASSTKLTASIPASAVATAGSANVTVTNPSPGGGTSTPAVFAIMPTNPAPTLTSVAPTTGILGQPASLTLTGSNLISASVVHFGANADSGGVVSNGGNTLTITIPGTQLASAGAVNISVTNPTPGGGTSSTVPFTIQNPVPASVTLSPTSTTAGGAGFTLTVNGTGFVNGASISFNGKAEATAFVSATQLTATIPAADIAVAANVNVVVTNPAPTAGGSAPAAFVINNPSPTVASLSPSSVTAGAAAFTLTVNGTNFVNGSKVNFNGSARTTTFASSTQVTASITAADVATASTANITVTNPTPGGGTSAATAFTVNNPAPGVTALSPPTVIAGSAGFTLMVTGTNFVSNSVVNFNGKAESTVLVSATQLSATIPASDIATGATVNVSVTNPSPGGGTSAPQSFSINNPAPVLTSLGQTHTPGGTAFTLTVNGQKFVTGSVINFGTKPETTTFVSTSQLTAAIPAADVATAGMVNITVSSPAPGGSPSSALSLTIDGFSASGPGGSTSVVAGHPAMFTITVAATDANGFPNVVSFSASGLPLLASASFSPMTVTPGATNATTTLAIATAGTALTPPAPPYRHGPPLGWPLTEMSFVTLLLVLLARLRRKTRIPVRGYAFVWPCALLMLTAALASGCAGGGGGSVSSPVTPPGTYPITVTATSGTLSQSTTVTLAVSAH